MASEAPPFWWEPADWRAWMLAPVSAIYGRIAVSRMNRTAVPGVDVPVLCVGNFTVGGVGKTPVSIALAHAAQARGLTPGIVSRGHGGSARRAHLVDLENDTAAIVGDEPLLLAYHAPTAVSPKRIDAAQLLVRHGCDFLIMDDGFQSARLRYNYALLVVDARHGIGNGSVIPGGPLRAPLKDQVRRADAVLRMGDGDAADHVIRLAARAGKPVFEAAARPSAAGWVAGKRLFAFAGIGHPQRFFDTLQRAGGELVEARAFPDHHVFSREQLIELAAAASAASAQLITTEKDLVRMSASLVPDGFRQRLSVLKIVAAFEYAETVDRILDETRQAFERRRSRL